MGERITFVVYMYNVNILWIKTYYWGDQTYTQHCYCVYHIGIVEFLTSLIPNGVKSMFNTGINPS